VRIDGDEPVSAAAELMLDTGVRHLVMVVDGSQSWWSTAHNQPDMPNLG
jgi:hypothetical protein